MSPFYPDHGVSAILKSGIRVNSLPDSGYVVTFFRLDFFFPVHELTLSHRRELHIPGVTIAGLFKSWLLPGTVVLFIA